MLPEPDIRPCLIAYPGYIQLAANGAIKITRTFVPYIGRRTGQPLKLKAMTPETKIILWFIAAAFALMVVAFGMDGGGKPF